MMQWWNPKLARHHTLSILLTRSQGRSRLRSALSSAYSTLTIVYTRSDTKTHIHSQAHMRTNIYTNSFMYVYTITQQTHKHMTENDEKMYTKIHIRHICIPTHSTYQHLNTYDIQWHQQSTKVEHPGVGVMLGGACYLFQLSYSFALH